MHRDALQSSRNSVVGRGNCKGKGWQVSKSLASGGRHSSRTMKWGRKERKTRGWNRAVTGTGAAGHGGGLNIDSKCDESPLRGVSFSN